MCFHSCRVLNPGGWDLKSWNEVTNGMRHDCRLIVKKGWRADDYSFFAKLLKSMDPSGKSGRSNFHNHIKCGLGHILKSGPDRIKSCAGKCGSHLKECWGFCHYWCWKKNSLLMAPNISVKTTKQCGPDYILCGLNHILTRARFSWWT